MGSGRWFPVDCASCRGPLLRVELTAATAPRVEVRHRRRRPGGTRTAWVRIEDLDDPAPVVHCDAGHLFAYVSLPGAGAAAVVEAVRLGADRGLLRPSRQRSGPVEVRGRTIDLDAGRDGPVMMGSPVTARREAAAKVAAVRRLFAGVMLRGNAPHEMWREVG